MGKVVKTITVCTCDVCGKECEEGENKVDITFSYALNDRQYIYGSLYAYVPYGTSEGIVCRSCKLYWLEQYIKRERNSENFK